MVARNLLQLLGAVALGGLTAVGMLACTDRPSAGPEVRRGWLVTVYYTAVQSFHTGTGVDVNGCLSIDCAFDDEPLGRYPRSFVEAVREEGTGRITSGPHASRYLNWSHDVGYWLDDAPRDALGRPLEPFRSAAADDLPDGTRLRLVDCGRLDSGEPVPAGVCAALSNGEWEIRDRFTPGLGGTKHTDLYIGEENQFGFTTLGELYVTLHDAAFAME